MTTFNDARKYWDSVAGVKTFTVPLPEDLFLTRILLSAAILDFGCGYGRSLLRLHELGYTHLAGCDLAPKMVALARHDLPSADLKVNDGVSIPFDDASCDVVLMLAVLTSIVADADQLKLLSEICRVLRPGGQLVVGDFLLNTDERNLARYRQYQPQFGTYGVFALPEEGAVLRHHDSAWLSTLFSGFERVEFRSTVYRTMNGHQSNGFYFVGRKICG